MGGGGQAGKRGGRVKFSSFNKFQPPPQDTEIYNHIDN